MSAPCCIWGFIDTSRIYKYPYCGGGPLQFIVIVKIELPIILLSPSSIAEMAVKLIAINMTEHLQLFNPKPVIKVLADD